MSYSTKRLRLQVRGPVLSRLLTKSLCGMAKVATLLSRMSRVIGINTLPGHARVRPRKRLLLVAVAPVGLRRKGEDRVSDA
jgi:hypothetical protein